MLLLIPLTDFASFLQCIAVRKHLLWNSILILCFSRSPLLLLNSMKTLLILLIALFLIGTTAASCHFVLKVKRIRLNSIWKSIFVKSVAIETIFMRLNSCHLAIEYTAMELTETHLTWVSKYIYTHNHTTRHTHVTASLLTFREQTRQIIHQL